MTIWEVQGYLPSIETSPIMKRHAWLIIANSFEEAIDEAHKCGARNIFNMTKLKIMRHPAKYMRSQLSNLQ